MCTRLGSQYQLEQSRKIVLVGVGDTAQGVHGGFIHVRIERRCELDQRIDGFVVPELLQHIDRTATKFLILERLDQCRPHGLTRQLLQ